MLLTERLLIKPSNENYKQIKKSCSLSKALYNEATYLFRQSFFNGEVLKWNQVDYILKKRKSRSYSELPSAAAQAMIRQMGDNWKAFWNAEYRSSLHMEE